MHYEEYGDKDAPLLLFLHGGGVSSWMWNEQIRSFTNYHCVTVDLPEQGKSTKAGFFSIQQSAVQVMEVIEKLANGKETAVVGFSLGAQIVIQMLSDYPRAIQYAVINSAFVKRNRIAEKVLVPLTYAAFPLVKNKMFAKLQAKALFVNDDDFEKYFSESRQMKPDTLSRIIRENMSFEIPASFSKAESRILVTVGENERAVMKQSAFEIMESNKNCSGIIIGDAGHSTPMSNPRLFNRLIEKWISGS